MSCTARTVAAARSRPAALPTSDTPSRRHQRTPTRLGCQTPLEITLEQWDAAKGGKVTSSFNLTEVRNNRQQTFAGRQAHLLHRDEDGTLRIREKHVFLANNDIPMPNLTFII